MIDYLDHLALGQPEDRDQRFASHPDSICRFVVSNLSQHHNGIRAVESHCHASRYFAVCSSRSEVRIAKLKKSKQKNAFSFFVQLSTPSSPFFEGRQNLSRLAILLFDS